MDENRLVVQWPPKLAIIRLTELSILGDNIAHGNMATLDSSIQISGFFFWRQPCSYVSHYWKCLSDAALRT